MKFCFICPEYPEGPHGGIGTYTQQTAKELSALGHQIRIIGVYPKSYPAPDYEENGNIKIWRLRVGNGKFGWIIPWIYQFRIIKKWVNENDIDLIEAPDSRGWYDIKQLIPAGKKAKFTNGLVVKYQVEINDKYWGMLFESEKITDEAKQKARITLEKENIKSFLTGMVNAGKVWFSGFYIDPLGKEQSFVRITIVNKDKEGGDWIQDMEEASSTACYSMGVHPSSIGATPGKSSSNMSGSNVREIFTMKQALEKGSKDIVLEPYFVIKNYNNWDVEFDIPFMQLTTLDKNTGAQDTTSNATDNTKK